LERVVLTADDEELLAEIKLEQGTDRDAASRVSTKG
jgi:hypothetical protein